MDHSKAKAAIDHFLANNPELEQLRAKLDTFNVFRALKIEERELCHSETLAWLLDPRESHGLGNTFLRRLLSSILLAKGDIQGISAATVEMMDFADVEVRREYRNIDVLAVVRDDPNLVLLIENKVKSGEGKNQLTGYQRIITQEFPSSSFKCIPVFLNLDGHPSEDEEASGYISYSHRDVLDVLVNILKYRQDQLPYSVRIFLEHYVETLRRLTMTDDEFKDLCEKIYRKHKLAIDAIVEFGTPDHFQRIAKEVIEAGGIFTITRSTGTEIRGVPRRWAPPVDRHVDVSCLLQISRDRDKIHHKIQFGAEVWNMGDPDARRRCIEALTAVQADGFRVGKDANRETAKSSRFFRLPAVKVDPSNEDDLKVRISLLLATADEQLKKADAPLKAVFHGP